MKVKKCTKCLAEKEATTSYFCASKRNKSGLGPECKECHSLRGIKYFAANKEKVAARSKKYRLANKEKLRGYSKNYREANKEKVIARHKKYRDNNKEKEAIRGKKYYADNKEKVAARCKNHRENNPDKYAATTAKYRATKLQATPSWANHGYIKLFYEGAKIEEKRTGRKVHVDHIVPLQGELVCGLHCEDNLQLLFAEANLSKNNKFEVVV